MALDKHPHQPRMDEVIRGLRTTSDKIRALAEAGYERADIARYLGKRYQHVRNVLLAPRPKRSRGDMDSSDPNQGRAQADPVRAVVGPGGQLDVPASLWRRARIARGESVIVTVEEGAIVVRGAAQAFEGAREMVRRLVPPGTGLVDDLIAERRREAGREERG